MPEGDTLRRLANSIGERFGGRRVERALVRDPRLVGFDPTGATLTTADAYGKHLFVRFDDGRTLHAHLALTGSFVVGRRSTEAEWRRRVELVFDDGWLTGESVPVLGAIATRDEHAITDALGPDLCAPSGPPNPDEIAARMRVAGDAPLAGAMLDQRIVAGFGNVYANEVPFVVGVHPAQRVGSIDALADAVAIGIALIRVNADRGPQNTTGRRLATDAHFVHGAGRRPCPVCGTRLEKWDETRAPWGRVTTWCPACQPERSGAAVDLQRAMHLIGLHPAARAEVSPLRGRPPAGRSG